MQNERQDSLAVEVTFVAATSKKNNRKWPQKLFYMCAMCVCVCDVCGVCVFVCIYTSMWLNRFSSTITVTSSSLYIGGFVGVVHAVRLAGQLKSNLAIERQQASSQPAYKQTGKHMCGANTHSRTAE